MRMHHLQLHGLPVPHLLLSRVFEQEICYFFFTKEMLKTRRKKIKE